MSFNNLNKLSRMGTENLKYERYYLMNKDKRILSFDIAEVIYGISIRNVKELEEVPEECKDIESWIANRSCAKHRRYIKEILIFLDLNNDYGFMKATHCLSLTDTLWIKSERERDLTWEDVSLYDNDFDEVISNTSFDGVGMRGSTLPISSPELVTDGMFEKCWVREKEIFLIKAGSFNNNRPGIEPYCEVLASQIFNRLCKSVKYELIKYRGRTASKCKLFTSERYGYVPFARRFNPTKDIGKLMSIYDEYEDTEELAGMIISDCITFNCDRHAGNFGFLADNDNFKIKGINPAFDFNFSFFPKADLKDINNATSLENYLKRMEPAIGYDYINSAKYVLTPRLIAELKNLKGIELTIQTDETFTKERLNIINKIVNMQINNILGGEPTYDFNRY